MKPMDLLEAMGSIRDGYIVEAKAAPGKKEATIGTSKTSPAEEPLPFQADKAPRNYQVYRGKKDGNGWKCFVILSVAAGLLLAILAGSGTLARWADYFAGFLHPTENPAQFTQPTEVTEPSKEPAVSSTRHVNRELSENLSLDAEAVLPGKDAYSTYTLKMVDGNPDRLFEILSPQGHGSYTKEDLRDRGYVVYHESSGKELVVRDDVLAINYCTYGDSGIDPMEELCSLMYYHTLEHPQAQPHDLSFMTVAEMEAFGKDILAQLGIAWEPILNKVVTLSGQEILDFQKEMFTKSSYTEFGTPLTLTEAEDTCYLEFLFAYDGLPIFGSDEPTVSYVDDGFAPSCAFATMTLNNNGIVDFDIRYPCTIASASEPETVLTLEEAISALYNTYDLQILFGSKKITGIYMEFIPIKQGTSMILTPYWCFEEINETQAGRPGYLGNANRFNAITGKDLAYGG